MFAIKGNQRHCQMIIKGVYFYHYWATFYLLLKQKSNPLCNTESFSSKI